MREEENAAQCQHQQREPDVYRHTTRAILNRQRMGLRYFFEVPQNDFVSADQQWVPNAFLASLIIRFRQILFGELRIESKRGRSLPVRARDLKLRRRVVVISRYRSGPRKIDIEIREEVHESDGADTRHIR